jgi:hypothetical protein
MYNKVKSSQFIYYILNENSSEIKQFMGNIEYNCLCFIIKCLYLFINLNKKNKNKYIFVKDKTDFYEYTDMTLNDRKIFIYYFKKVLDILNVLKKMTNIKIVMNENVYLSIFKIVFTYRYNDFTRVYYIHQFNKCLQMKSIHDGLKMLKSFEDFYNYFNLKFEEIY